MITKYTVRKRFVEGNLKGIVITDTQTIKPELGKVVKAYCSSNYVIDEIIYCEPIA